MPEIYVHSRQRIGGQHQVGLLNLAGDLIPVRGGFAHARPLGIYPQVREPSRGLFLPRPHQTGRDHHEHRRCGVRGTTRQLQLLPSNDRQHLHSLAQAHVVSQDAAQTGLGPSRHPTETILLIPTPSALCQRGSRYFGRIHQQIDGVFPIAGKLARCGHRIQCRNQPEIRNPDRKISAAGKIVEPQIGELANQAFQLLIFRCIQIHPVTLGSLPPALHPPQSRQKLFRVQILLPQAQPQVQPVTQPPATRLALGRFA